MKDKGFLALSFRQQLIMLLVGGILIASVVSTFIISEFSSRSVERNLVDEGMQVTENLASQSTLGLLLASPENVQDAVTATLNFPDVRGVGIYDLERKPLLEVGIETKADLSGEWLEETSMRLETDEAWYFMAPVYSGTPDELNPFGEAVETELIGYVRVVKTKETLHALEGSILKVNTWVSLGLATALLILMLALTTRVTEPLRKLIDAMLKAKDGDSDVRAELVGPVDIMEMEGAFNTMMDALAERGRQLESARDAALESARVKGEFAANVSHELRTPLNGILGMLELLEDMGLTPKQREYILVAKSSSDALLALIDDILDFSRVDSGKLQIVSEDFNLRELLDDVISILSGQAQAKDLDIAYLMAPTVPAYVNGDSRRVRQLLVNLGGNALKFTSQGEVAFHINTSARSSDDLVLRFEVADTGVGIPEEAMGHIFDAFSQADGSTTRKYGGTGLGLAICRQLVDVLGGEIGVESEVGQGSRFWFEIPFEPSSYSIAPENENRQAAMDLRTLVIDDSEISQYSMLSTLESWGAQVDCADDAELGVMRLRHASQLKSPYDIVFVDEIMPGSNGIELIRRIVKDEEITPTKLVLMTNQAHAESFIARFPEIDSYTRKPILQSALFDCIATVMHGERRTDSEESDHDGTTITSPISANILIAEDNRANQQVAIGMLERIGCKVTVAVSGLEALDLVTRHPFDLVLMDCNMPEMDGYEASEKIRQLSNHVAQIPIIAMTANVQEGDRQKCLRAGMDDYLSKPLKMDKLRVKLLRWLGDQTNEEHVDTVIEKRKKANEGESANLPEQETVIDVGDAINLERLNELKESVGEGYLGMLDVFLEDLPVLMTSLEKAVANEEHSQIQHYAHSIKGSCKNFGADRVAELAKVLEDMGRDKALVDARAHLSELFEAADTVIRFFKEEITPSDVYNTTAEPGESESARILIADDDRSMRVALINVLDADGYVLEEVGDGAQAVKVCESNMPDLVLIDAMMPEMDGFEACERIRAMEDSKHVPILIITALDDEQSIERAFDVGATDYVPKPLHFAVLKQRIARLLHASRAERHVRVLAYKDPLTNLPNRTMFISRLRELLSKLRLEEDMLAVLFLDLNRFKLVNDTLGHGVGDLLLKAVAERIQRCVRSGDMVARLGGDEFTVILDHVSDHDDVARIAQDICTSLNQPFSFAGQEMFVSTSIGISVFPEDGEDIDALMKHADTAMFRAKEQGVNYYFYEKYMAAAVTRKVEIEADLRHSIDRDQIDVYYQPKADLRTREIVGMEALVRWIHPVKGIVGPNEFIPLAEETGLINEVGLWVMISACVQLRAWIDAGYAPYTVSVNLSGVQLERGNIISQVKQVLEQTGLEASYLELEITESTIMKDPEKVIGILNKLKEMGVSLSIDDFGTGYSSLSYLKRFPIDILKIDAGFVRDIATDPDDKAIIRGIIALAKSLRIKVIAEGVETREQEEFLREEDCDYIQGYYVGRPLGAEEFELKVLEQIKVGRSVVSDMSNYRAP